jgi:hypothetical protein
MTKYVIYEDKETGKLSAHTEQYTKKEGEKKVGSAEGANAEEALKAHESGQEEDAPDNERYSTAVARRKLSPEEEEEEKEKGDEQARKEEESKKEFTVMARGDGTLYVEGEDEGGGSKKKAKASEPPPENEESEVGVFRARSAKEALAMAKGEYVNPAAGAQRGAQTP